MHSRNLFKDLHPRANPILHPSPTSAADPSWTAVMEEALSVHAGLIYNSFDSDVSLTNTVSHMLAKMALITCADLPDCGWRRRSLYRE